MTALARLHADWCAGGHRCHLGEHRSHPHMVDVPGAGRVVITRVQGVDGRGHAEIRASLALTRDEPQARIQLHRIMTDLAWSLGRARPPEAL